MYWGFLCFGVVVFFVLPDLESLSHLSFACVTEHTPLAWSMDDLFPRLERSDLRDCTPFSIYFSCLVGLVPWLCQSGAQGREEGFLSGARASDCGYGKGKSDRLDMNFVIHESQHVSTSPDVMLCLIVFSPSGHLSLGAVLCMPDRV